MRNIPPGAWGIEDVCLIGGYDDVPMRRTAQDVGYGQPETDYYYAELSLPDEYNPGMRMEIINMEKILILLILKLK